ELYKEVPQIGRAVTALTNSDYSSGSSYLKNCYLVFNSDYSDDSMYCTFLERSKQCLDLYVADLCELSYDSSNVFKDYNVRYSKRVNESVNVYFSKNLHGCTDCFGCFNLKNKQYHIFNKPYSKEDYFKTLEKFDLGSYKFVQEMKEKMAKLEQGFPKRYAEGLNNTNVIGDLIFNSKDCFYCNEVGDCENCKWTHFMSIASTKDSYDYMMWGGGAELMYECMGAGGGANNVRFCYMCWGATTNMEYAKDILKGTDDVFGCSSLKKKRFCILNKQYTEKEFHDLRAKIIEHMDKMPYVDSKGRVYKYGEFFPADVSHYAYNESMAQAFFPLSKAEALRQGYKWRDLETARYKATMKSAQLPDHIKDVPDSIVKEVIECEHTGECLEQCPTAFKITQQELDFYRRQSIPLPRLCHNCRHYGRFLSRNHISKLWPGKCRCAGAKSSGGEYLNQGEHFHGTSKCPNEFQTPYSPEKSNILYCEQCYKEEVI
ncbi:hypothetical protein HY224_01995, partial [Candidatus Uhrbacteria bacterium]|nr:hypothetical protein [Candidatus Uhrbacteria bacterium]